MKLSKLLFVFTLLIGILVTSGCVDLEEGSKKLVLNTSKGVRTYDVEIADTKEERSEGLMHRESLAENTGMFFLYEEEQPTMAFWMKNMEISLDMIFFDEDMKVVDYFENVPPCEQDICPHYKPSVSSQYVLEVNAGEIRKIDLERGDMGELK
jgi:uncharacterized membrane protein (UPF0127 family)